MRWIPKTGPTVKMDFWRSACEKKADHANETETAWCSLQGQGGIRSPGWASDRLANAERVWSVSDASDAKTGGVRDYLSPGSLERRTRESCLHGCTRSLELKTFGRLWRICCALQTKTCSTIKAQDHRGVPLMNGKFLMPINVNDSAVFDQTHYFQNEAGGWGQEWSA